MTTETEQTLLREIRLIRQEIQDIKKAEDLEMLTIKEIGAILKISSKHIYAMIKKGIFPEPEKFGDASRWKKTEVEDYRNGDWKPKAAA